MGCFIISRNQLPEIEFDLLDKPRLLNVFLYHAYYLVSPGGLVPSFSQVRNFLLFILRLLMEYIHKTTVHLVILPSVLFSLILVYFATLDSRIFFHEMDVFC
jgi:hypothetical protein